MVDVERWVRACGGGDPIASSAMQPGLSLFETSFGVWPYRRVAGVEITLGGPLCAPGDRRAMLRRFLAASRRPILFYLREDMLAEIAAVGGAGLRCAGVGVDRHVDIQALLTRPDGAVRGAIRKADKAGLALVPLDRRHLDAGTRTRLDQITARYFAAAKVREELGFLNWPMSWAAQDPRRVFALAKHDREHDGVFGYAVLNPIFDAGVRTGWLLDILRFEPTRLWGVWLSTVAKLARLLADEGEGEALSVGFAPLCRIRAAPHVGRSPGSAILQAQLEWMVRYLSTTRYLMRLRELKDAVPGREEPRFVASFTPLAPRVLHAFLAAMGVAPRYVLGPGLVRVLGEGIANTRQQRRRAWPRGRTSTHA